MRLFGAPATIRQDPWFICLISRLAVGKPLKGCGLTEEVQAFDRKAYEAGIPIIPPVTGSEVLREDLRIPMADGHLNSARLFNQQSWRAMSSSRHLSFISTVVAGV